MSGNAITRRKLTSGGLAVLAGCTLNSCIPPTPVSLRGDLCEEVGLVHVPGNNSMSLTRDGYVRRYSARKANGEVITYELIEHYLRDRNHGPVFRFLCGATSDGRFLVTSEIHWKLGLPEAAIGLVDLVGDRSFRVWTPGVCLDFRSSYDGTAFLVLVDCGLSLGKCLYISKGRREWKRLAGVVASGSRWPFGLFPDGSCVIYSDGSTVYFYDVDTGKRTYAGSGTSPTCPGNTDLFSYVDPRGMLVLAPLADPLRVQETNIVALDGVSWSPDGSCGIIAQPSDRATLMSALRDLYVLSYPELKLRLLSRVVSASGSIETRWATNIERVPVRLQAWLDRIHS